MDNEPQTVRIIIAYSRNLPIRHSTFQGIHRTSGVHPWCRCYSRVAVFLRKALRYPASDLRWTSGSALSSRHLLLFPDSWISIPYGLKNFSMPSSGSGCIRWATSACTALMAAHDFSRMPERCSFPVKVISCATVSILFLFGLLRSWVGKCRSPTGEFGNKSSPAWVQTRSSQNWNNFFKIQNRVDGVTKFHPDGFPIR